MADDMKSIKQIEIELGRISRPKMVDFAWRCAIRSLPLIELMSNQRDLFVFFRALDASAYASLNAYIDPSNFSFYYKKSNNISNSAFYCVRAAFADTYSDVLRCVLDLVSTFVEKSPSEDSLKEIVLDLILQDLHDVKSNVKPVISVTSYGSAWDDFQSTLSEFGCQYWADLYDGIFKNNFVYNVQELEQRLNLPKEIITQGAASVGAYMEELLEKGAKRLNEARIIILGDKGAGKTCVARRILNPEAEMTTPEESTAGVDTSLWELEEDNIRVRIWDFAGHTVTHAVHQFFLSERCLYIIVDDGRTENRSSLDYWLSHMRNYGGDSEAIILQNEKDPHKLEIPINSLREKYAIAGYYSFNVKDDKRALENFRKNVADYIKHKPSWRSQELPNNYYSVKEQLENLFTKSDNGIAMEHIPKKDFVVIAQKYQVKDVDRLLKNLHALGISLWYQKMVAFDTLILNPEWISQGVYQIINWISNQNGYSLSLHNFKQVFAENINRYPIDKHKFLFELIKHYELAYEIDEGTRLIFPHLLGEDQPTILPRFNATDSLMIKYVADHPLPPHTISRFIVRHNYEIKQIDNDFGVWKFGVILEKEGECIALVREIDRAIFVSVKGENSTAFISAIRETLNSIFKSYKNKLPKLEYKVWERLSVDRDLWLQEQEIAILLARRQPYYDLYSNKSIPLTGTVNVYNINGDYFNVKGNENILMARDRNWERHYASHLPGKNKEQAESNIEARKKEELKNLVAKGETKSALEGLMDFAENLSSEKNTEVTLLYGRFSRYESQARKGILSKNEMDMRIAQINVDILGMIDVE